MKPARGIRTVVVVVTLLGTAAAAHALTATPTRTRTPTRTLTPTPTGTPASPVLFRDDFSGDLSRWEVVKDTWDIVDGQLRGTASRSAEAWIYAGDEEWTDYAVETLLETGSSTAAFALRSTGHWQDEYRVDVCTECSPLWYDFQRYRDGRWTNLKQGGFHGPIANPVIVRVEVFVSSLRLFLDGMLVDSVADPEPLARGRFALGVRGQGILRFDNVTVVVTREGCGDGIVDPNQAEECEDGNTDPSDGCTNACTICGNGTVSPWEECDDGNPSNEDGCRNDCRRNVCGDGYSDPATEQCDDRNTKSCDGCSDECRNESPGYRCGDGIVRTACGEVCDDGNTSNNDACRNDCQRNLCGDGYRNPAAEQCDDGNTDPADGCTTACTICGDGIITSPEQCDDGNLVDGDGCSPWCAAPGCGNAIVEGDEECDDGGVCVDGPDAGTYCSGPEQCSSGECRASGGDGCAANCTEESAYPIVFDPEASGLAVQNVVIRIPSADMKVSGQLSLQLGASRESSGSDEIPAAVRAADVRFGPVKFPGLPCTCIRAIDGPGLPEGVSGTGSISCAGPLGGVDVLSSLDHNTDDVDPNCVFGEVEASGPCVNGICESGLRKGEQCNGSSDCNAPHSRVCNGPEEVSFSGTGPVGSMRLDLRLRSWSIANNSECTQDCGNADNGLDCLPCTEDDPGASESGAADAGTGAYGPGPQEFSLLPPEFDLRLTTGRAAAEILDANNQRGKSIAAGSRTPCDAGTGCATPERCWNLATRKACATGESGCECRLMCGSSPCSTSATGKPVNCEALAQGLIDTDLAAAVAAFDQVPFGDSGAPGQAWPF